MRDWYFIGDSHAQSFEAAANLQLLNRPARCLAVPGATSIGLRNPESHTHAVTLFKEALLPAHPDAIPVIQLGEVDCGFVIWWRAQRHGDCVDRQMEESVAACAAFLDDLLRRLDDLGEPGPAESVAKSLKMMAERLRLQAESGAVASEEIGSVRSLACELMQAVDAARPLDAMMAEVSVAVAGYRSRLEQMAQAKAEAAKAAVANGDAAKEAVGQ